LRLWQIVINTIRESVREKIFSVFSIVGIGLMILSVFLGFLSFDEQSRILFNIGFLGIHISAISTGIFLGSFAIPREIERQTCLLVLARPISRAQFYIGKGLGVILLNGAMILTLSVFLGTLLAWKTDIFSFFAISIGIFFEASILTALCLLGGVLMRPAIAVIGGYGLFLIGQWLPELHFFASKSDSAIFKAFSSALELGAPNLYRLNWRSSYWMVNSIDINEFISAIGHGVAWIFILFLIGDQLFRRRDIV
jgi:ABC-type transport system involved in multi-copper enzyme maturation permease subunit